MKTFGVAVIFVIALNILFYQISIALDWHFGIFWAIIVGLVIGVISLIAAKSLMGEYDGEDGTGKK